MTRELNNDIEVVVQSRKSEVLALAVNSKIEILLPAKGSDAGTWVASQPGADLVLPKTTSWWLGTVQKIENANFFVEFTPSRETGNFPADWPIR